MIVFGCACVRVQLEALDQRLIGGRGHSVVASTHAIAERGLTFLGERVAHLTSDGAPAPPTEVSTDTDAAATTTTAPPEADA